MGDGIILLEKPRTHHKIVRLVQVLAREGYTFIEVWPATVACWPLIRRQPGACRFLRQVHRAAADSREGCPGDVS